MIEFNHFLFRKSQLEKMFDLFHESNWCLLARAAYSTNAHKSTIIRMKVRKTDNINEM